MDRVREQELDRTEQLNRPKKEKKKKQLDQWREEESTRMNLGE